MNMTNSQKGMAVIGGSATWCVIAILLDRYFLREKAPWFSQLLYLRDAEIVVQPFSRTFSWLGLNLLIVAPSFAVGVCLALYLRLRKRLTSQESMVVFGVTAFWFLAIPFLVWVGHNLYNFFKGLLDGWAWAKGIVAFLDGFTFTGDLYVYSFKLVSIHSGLGALAGLVLGTGLLYKKALWETIRGKLKV